MVISLERLAVQYFSQAMCFFKEGSIISIPRFFFKFTSFTMTLSTPLQDSPLKKIRVGIFYTFFITTWSSHLVSTIFQIHLPPSFSNIVTIELAPNIATKQSDDSPPILRIWWCSKVWCKMKPLKCWKVSVKISNAQEGRSWLF